MKTITAQDKKYEQIVTVHSEDHYTINCNEITPDEEVVCPYDKDMKVSKTPDGAIILKKKSFLHPFSFKPE